MFGVFRSAYLNKQSPVSVQEAHFIQKAAFCGGDRQRERPGAGMLRPGQRPAGRGVQRGKGRLRHGFYHRNLFRAQPGARLHQRGRGLVGLRWADGSTTWGAGTDTDIIQAGVKALASAVNNK